MRTASPTKTALGAAGRRLAGYPELTAVLAAAVIGLAARRPLAWLAAHQGINAALAVLVLATAVTIDPAALRRLAQAWRRVLAATAVGVTVLPALSWAVAQLVPAGPLRDGVLVTGLAPAEIASVATTGLAGGEAAVAAGVLIGSTLATVVLAAPVLTLETSSGGFSPGGLITNLALVVALPLAAGIALRGLVRPTRELLATSGADTAASRTALAAVAVLVALVAAEVRLSAGYAAAAGALLLFLAASAVLGALLGRGAARPVKTALLLTISMRDFAIAAALAAAAFGPGAAAPLGLYGIAVLVWGTAVAGVQRRRASRGQAEPGAAAPGEAGPGQAGPVQPAGLS